MRVVALGYNYVCSQTLYLNFSPFNSILGPYKQKEKSQENFHLTKILIEM